MIESEQCIIPNLGTASQKEEREACTRPTWRGLSTAKQHSRLSPLSRLLRPALAPMQ